MEYEDRIRIATPEGVDVELTLAGIGSRFIAGALDFAIQIALIGAVSLLFAAFNALEVGPLGLETDEGDANAVGIAILTVALFVITFGYDILFEVKGGGKTLGKRVTGLRVVRSGGRPVNFVTSAIRNVMRIVDILPGFYGLAVLVVFVTPRNQRLGDLAAGTLVIRERLGDRRFARRRVAATAIDPGRAASWDVSAVSAPDVATVREFLERRNTLAVDARAHLAGELSSRLRPQVAGSPDGMPAEEFLELLAAAKAVRA